MFYTTIDETDINNYKKYSLDSDKVFRNYVPKNYQQSAERKKFRGTKFITYVKKKKYVYNILIPNIEKLMHSIPAATSYDLPMRIRGSERIIDFFFLIWR